MVEPFRREPVTTISSFRFSCGSRSSCSKNNCLDLGSVKAKILARSGLRLGFGSVRHTERCETWLLTQRWYRRKYAIEIGRITAMGAGRRVESVFTEYSSQSRLHQSSINKTRRSASSTQCEICRSRGPLGCLYEDSL